MSTWARSASTARRRCSSSSSSAGYGRLYGAFVGAVAYMALSHFLAKVYPTAWQLGLGLLLVVIALFARNGILGLVENLWRRRRAAEAGR